MSFKKIQNYINVEGIQTSISSLSSSVDTLNSTTTTKTTEIMNIYVDGDSGDDTDDGLSWATAKKTFLAGWNLIPIFVQHNVFLNLRGTIAEADNELFFSTPARFIAYSRSINVLGEFDAQTVLLGPLTSDLGSTSTIGLSSLTMTTDEYAGYFIEILDGTYAGFRRTIIANTDTTFTVSKNFAGSVAGSQFRIYKPATTIEPQISFSDITGQGNLNIQDLTAEGGTYTSINVYNNTATANFNAVIINTTYSSAIGSAKSSIASQYFSRYYDPSSATGLGSRSTTTYNQGLSILNKKKLQLFGGGYWYGGASSVFGYVEFNNIQPGLANNCFDFGCRIIGGLTVNGMRMHSNSSYLLYSRSGYAKTRVGSGSIGVELIESQVTFGGNQDVVIDYNTSHGIYAEHSYLQMKRVVSGSDNGGFSLLARKNSFVDFSNGQTPTLSGTLGSVSVDGTNPTGSSWADIAAGNKISYAEEFTVVKKA